MLHNRTYISLNDLTELNLFSEDLQAAEESSSQAVEIGKQLYPKDLRKVRSLLNRAETLERLQQDSLAENIYLRIDEFQEQHADSAVNRGETLHRLGQLYDRQKSYGMAISCYRKTVKLHQASDEEDRAGELQWTYVLLAEEEKLYGAQAQELSDNLNLIARIYDRQGDEENARKYQALSAGLSPQQE